MSYLSAGFARVRVAWRSTFKLGNVLAVGACWLLALPAHAQNCARPDLLEAFPADGSQRVPLNAILSAHYFASAEYDGEPVVLEQVGGERREMLATFSPSEGLLALDPAGFLKAQAAYVVEWPALRGINSASRGRGQKVSFTVGARNDEALPEFAGVKGVSYRLEREQDGCAGTVQDRFIFGLTFDPPSDETSVQDLSLVVFQTRQNSADPALPVLTRSFPEDGRVEVARPIDESLGNICFAALVRDLTGKVSASADRVVCTKTVRPPFFHGCALSAVGAERPAALGFVLLVGGVWAVRRRRAR